MTATTGSPRTTASAVTAYAYGPDGARVKTTVTPLSGPVTTSYLLGATEIDAAGVYTKVPHADVRIVGTAACFVRPGRNYSELGQAVHGNGRSSVSAH